MRKTYFLVLLTIIITATSYSQENCIIATYNILNYPGNDTTARNPNLRIVMSSVNPDILVVQEMLSQDGVDEVISDREFHQVDLF